MCYEDALEGKNENIKYHNHMENEIVYVFIAGLNQELDDVCGRIHGKTHFRSLSEVFV